MALLDEITVGDIVVATADVSPISSGIPLPLGSIVTLTDGSGMFVKTGSGSTAYDKSITAANLTDITSVGTITSGTWQGTPIVDAYLANISWSKILSTPTTLAGYGITNALSTTMTNGTIYVGNGSNIATQVTPTGDLTISNTGTTTLATVNSNVFGSNTFLKFAVNAKGLVTAASAVGQSDITGALTYTPVNRAGDTMTGFLTLNADPTSALHAATKGYVDSFIAGSITWKQEVKAATTANITLLGAQVVDSYSASVNDRILVKNQTTTTENGIYLVSAGAWTRTSDADTGAEISSATVMVQFGATNKDTQWTCSNSTDPVIGTDPISFAQIAGPGTYLAGTGLALTGNTFSIDSTVVTLTGSQVLSNKTISGLANTISNIANSSLINSSITINGTPTSLGGSISVGTVTSVAVSGSEFSIGGSPITSSGTITLALATQGGLTPGTYNNVTVNSKGIATSGSNVSYLTANQTITLTGDVTGSGATSIATTIANSAVTNAKIANATIDLTAKVTGVLPTNNGGSGTGTTFTVGSVVFAGSSGIYAQDNANFFWDDTNNRLGVGNSSPQQTLHVSGIARFEGTSGVLMDASAATVNTTDATTTTLQSITVPTDTVLMIETRIHARKTGGTGAGTTGDGNGYIRQVKAKNVSGTVTIGTVNSVYTAEDVGAFNVSIDVSGTTVRIRVLGAVNDNVTWTCTTLTTR